MLMLFPLRFIYATGDEKSMALLFELCHYSNQKSSNLLDSKTNNMTLQNNNLFLILLFINDLSEVLVQLKHRIAEAEAKVAANFGEEIDPVVRCDFFHDLDVR